MWKWILQIAVMVGKSDWAKDMAKKVIEKLRHKAELQIHSIAAAADIAVPPASAIRAGRLVRTRTDTLKPDQVVLVDGQRLRITRLISSSAAETVYEADALP